MTRVKLILLFLLICWLAPISNAQSDLDSQVDEVIINGDIHVISIGIDDYPEHPLNFCASDATIITKKVLLDNGPSALQNTRIEEAPIYSTLFGKKITVDKGRRTNYPIGNVYTHQLNNENASIENIRKAFKQVISDAAVDDYFILFFSGFTVEMDDGMTYLIPYNPNIIFEELEDSKLFSLVEMAKLMEQISAEKQLVISEAGNGSIFAENLISQLFESNPLIASATKRNRIILTTKNIGIEVKRCPDGTKLETGFMARYIYQSGNILDVFYSIEKYEFDLIKAETACAWNQNKYIALYQESTFKNILIKNFKKTNSRGSKSINIRDNTKNENSNESTIHAIIIATDSYDETIEWANLKNPINDAEGISKVLADKYGAKIHKLYNKTKEELLAKIIELKMSFNPNDKLLFFVAGHGFYSTNFSDGYIVLKDSKQLKGDVTLNSYLQMATLNRMLDNMAPKNVFAIFDICFGASFDLNAKDIRLSDYTKLERDISLNDFINRKSNYTSRLFLASGAQEVPDYWNNSLDHSPFANKLIKSLAQESEFISPGKLFAKLEGNITAPIMKQFGKHDVAGDFLLKVN